MSQINFTMEHLMTEPSLREKFAKVREKQKAIRRDNNIVEANTFLNSLADNFEALLNEKIAKDDVLDPQPGEDRAAFGPVIVFKHESLRNITLGDAQAMEGYSRLKEICRKPEIDLCLGEPQWATFYDRRPVEIKEIRVYISKPYSASEEALWDAVPKSAPDRKGYQGYDR
jgi:hypothetical protein